MITSPKALILSTVSIFLCLGAQCPSSKGPLPKDNLVTPLIAPPSPPSKDNLTWEKLGYELIPISGEKFRCWLRVSMYVLLDFLRNQPSDSLEKKWEALINTNWEAGERPEGKYSQQLNPLMHMATLTDADDKEKSRAVVNWFKDNLHKIHLKNGRFVLENEESGVVEDRLLFIALLTNLYQISSQTDEINQRNMRQEFDEDTLTAVCNNTAGSSLFSKTLGDFWGFSTPRHHSFIRKPGEGIWAQYWSSEEGPQYTQLTPESAHQYPLIIESTEGHFQIRRFRNE